MRRAGLAARAPAGDSRTIPVPAVPGRSADTANSPPRPGVSRATTPAPIHGPATAPAAGWRFRCAQVLRPGPGRRGVPDPAHRCRRWRAASAGRLGRAASPARRSRCLPPTASRDWGRPCATTARNHPAAPARNGLRRTRWSVVPASIEPPDDREPRIRQRIAAGSRGCGRRRGPGGGKRRPALRAGAGWAYNRRVLPRGVVS